MALAKGTAQLNTGVDEKLLDEFRRFVEARGEKLRAALETAMRRHMDNPPPLPDPPPPLPPVTSPAPPADVQKGRRAKKK